MKIISFVKSLKNNKVKNKKPTINWSVYYANEYIDSIFLVYKPSKHCFKYLNECNISLSYIFLKL